MNFISEDFHLHYLASYTLYIKSGFQSDHILVISKEGNVLVFLKYDTNNPCAEAKRVLALPFTQVFVHVSQQNLIWVPSEVYDVTDKDIYKSYFLNEEVDKILTKDFQSLQAVALYQLDSLVMSRWLKIYPQTVFIPSFELLINQIEKKCGLPTTKTVLAVHLYDNQVDIVLFVNGEFKLYNTYEINTVDDLSYYIISIMKNFSLTTKLEEIVVAGVGPNSDYINRLHLYADHIELLNPVGEFGYENTVLKNVLLHTNLLIDTAICE